MWKKWLLTIVLLIVIMLSLALWYMNQLIHQTTFDMLRAGQKVLNTTVMNSIEKGYKYTGGPTEYVFFGKDAANRNVWSFISEDGKQIYCELEGNGYPLNKIEKIAQQSPVTITHIIHAMPGMTDPSVTTEFSKKTNNKLVWEIYGKDTNGQLKYAYYDFYTGKLLWSYNLHS
jgi:uncharacterized protein YpmB